MKLSVVITILLTTALAAPVPDARVQVGETRETKRWCGGGNPAFLEGAVGCLIADELGDLVN